MSKASHFKRTTPQSKFNCIRLNNLNRSTVDTTFMRVVTDNFNKYQYQDLEKIPENQKHLIQGIYLDHHMKDDKYFTEEFINEVFF